MEFEQEIIKKINEVSQNKDEKVTLGELKMRRDPNKKVSTTDGPPKKERIKFQNVLSDQSQIKSDNLYPYYCSLCGQLIVTSDMHLENFSQRKTDKAYAIPLKEEIFVKFHFNNGERVVLKREDKIELQYRLKCTDCGIDYGYQTFSFGKRIPENACIYVYHDSFVTNVNFSKLINVVTKFKEQNGLI